MPIIALECSHKQIDFYCELKTKSNQSSHILYEFIMSRGSNLSVGRKYTKQCFYDAFYEVCVSFLRIELSKISQKLYFCLNHFIDNIVFYVTFRRKALIGTSNTAPSTTNTTPISTPTKDIKPEAIFNGGKLYCNVNSSTFKGT